MYIIYIAAARPLSDEPKPKWVKEAGECSAKGDPHFRSFDGKKFNFQVQIFFIYIIYYRML